MGQNKLDFYYKYKRHFRYETYLDNIEKHNRMHLTRLRLSSHNLPIEVLRYNKTKRNERKCTICNLDEVGNEDHYLNRCNNRKLEDIRKYFFNNIKTINTQLETFDNTNIIDYCLSMNDKNIHLPTALFIQKLLKAYKEESNVPTLQNICKQYINKKLHIKLPNTVTSPPLCNALLSSSLSSSSTQALTTTTILTHTTYPNQL